MLSMCDDFANYFYKFLVWYGLISGTAVSRMNVYLLINRSVIREGEILNLVLISDIQMLKHDCIHYAYKLPITKV